MQENKNIDFLKNWTEEADHILDAGKDGKNLTYQVSSQDYFVTVFIHEYNQEVALVLSVMEK